MKTIAVLGASKDRSKFGNKAVRAFHDAGYKVYPVHPKETEVEGHKAYLNVESIPENVLDMVSFYLPPAIGLKVIQTLDPKKVREVWLNPGAESDEIIAAGEARGLNIIAACSIVGIGKSPSQY